MITTKTKLIFDDEDLLNFIKKEFKGDANFQEDREHTTFMKMVFRDCIEHFGFKNPKQYPCLAKLTMCQINGMIDVSWRWYYYNDIIFWEQKMKEYKYAIKNKIKISERIDFIL